MSDNLTEVAANWGPAACKGARLAFYFSRLRNGSGRFSRVVDRSAYAACVEAPSRSSVVAVRWVHYGA